jgi:hypothetical protein
MRKQQIENAAFEVATQIRTVEDSIDTTLSEIAELQCRMLSVNALAHVGPAPIHSALEELSAALSSLIAARGSIVGCHTQLVEAKGKVPGLRTTSFGDEGQCPPPSAQVDLRIVA